MRLFQHTSSTYMYRWAQRTVPLLVTYYDNSVFSHPRGRTVSAKFGNLAITFAKIGKNAQVRDPFPPRVD